MFSHFFLLTSFHRPDMLDPAQYRSPTDTGLSAARLPHSLDAIIEFVIQIKNKSAYSTLAFVPLMNISFPLCSNALARAYRKYLTHTHRTSSDVNSTRRIFPSS